MSGVVIQADSDAAVRCCENALRNIHPNEAENIDFPAMVEHFARHRIAGQAKLVEALEALEQAEMAYRAAHDLYGDGSRECGRAWDLMRRAGNTARAVLSQHSGEHINNQQEG